jgi:hypothetical protein
MTVKHFIFILYKKYLYVLLSCEKEKYICALLAYEKEEYIYSLLVRERQKCATCGNSAAIVAAVVVSASWYTPDRTQPPAAPLAATMWTGECQRRHPVFDLDYREAID